MDCMDYGAWVVLITIIIFLTLCLVVFGCLCIRACKKILTDDDFYIP